MRILGQLDGSRAKSFPGIAALVAANLLTLAALATAADHVTFDGVFAPQEGKVAEIERPMRDELCLNGSWQFQPIANPAGYKPNSGDTPTLPPPSADGWDNTPLRVPSPWNINAFPYGANKGLGDGGDFRCYPSYPQSWESADMGWLRRTFRAPAGGGGARYILHFDAVAGAVQVIVNGKTVGEHFDSFLPFEFDVTDALKPDGDNELLVGIRRPDLFNKQTQIGRRPYPAGSMWAESVVGIWQDVTLIRVPAVHITDTFVKPLLDQDTLAVDVTVKNDARQDQTLTLAGDVHPWVNLSGNDPATAPLPKWKLDPTVLSLPSTEITLPAGQTKTVTLQIKTGGKLKTWSPDTPSLYGLITTIQSGGALTDNKYTRFGWRQMMLTKDGLLLNGQPFKIKGDAWHFLGIPEMTRRYAWAWYSAVKAAHCNAVRLHAQPYPPFFMDVADEMGVMVLDESAIWGSDASSSFDLPVYWQRADNHITDLVLRDRNHPSVLGYSLTNEVLVILKNRRATKETTDMVLGRYTKWVNEIHQIDPTHPWISGDGEEDAGGRLPTVLGHYGGADGPRRWSQMGKPWGVGESGMAYYGTPKQVSEYNGADAYRSMAGRMNGVAIQAYDLITKTHIANNATYSSVFNIVWYGLQPLPLGLKDTSRAPTIDDGIYFTHYTENTPGVQPERLGPYCTTLNPGYDPSLPLYKTWPLFDAIKAANAPGGPQPSPYDQRTPQPQVIPPPPATVPAVQLVAGKGDDARIELTLLGVPLEKADAASPAQVLVVSGSAPVADAKTKIDQTLAAGGTVIVWHPKRAKLDELSAALPAALKLNNRTSTSLVPASDDALAAGLSPADFYFSELKPDVILDGGLEGPLMEGATPVLVAPAVDWRVWNGKPEIIKTGSVARSESETKPRGIAVAEVPSGKGRIVIVNLSGLTTVPERVAAGRRLLANFGIKLNDPRDMIGGGLFTNGGALRQALFVGRFPIDDADHTTAGPGPGTALPTGPATDNPTPGMKVANTTWQPRTADNTLSYDINHLNLPEGGDNSAVYVSFWINSPRSLDDVLGEPDVPHVDLLIGGSDKAGGMWLNGEALKDDPKAIDGAAAKSAFPAINLKRGWNHVLIRLSHRTGNWNFNATLRCSDSEYMSTLKAALTLPNQAQAK